MPASMVQLKWALLWLYSRPSLSEYKRKNIRGNSIAIVKSIHTSRSAMGKTDAESLSSLAKHLLKGISQQGQTLLPSPTTEQCPIGRPVAPVSFTVGVTPSQLHHRLPKSPPISPAVYPVADEWTQEVIAAEATLSRCTSVNEHLPSPILSASVSDDDSTSYNDINHKKKDDDDDDDDSGGRHRSSKTLVKVLQKAVLNPSISVASLKCPDPAVVQHLITIYVRRTHPQLPLFSLSWLNGLISSGNIPLGLLTAIMALGARFSKKLPRSGEIGGLLNNQARMLLQRSLDNPDVTTVQTAILTSVYFYSEGNGPMAFACQSLSYRLSRIVQNKLRQMSAVSSNKLNGMDDNSINYDETWRRTWWYTFMSNRFSSARTGQAFGEHFTKQEVPMPTEECNDMKYYPEFDGPIREESTSEACKGEQHGPLLAKYQYARFSF
ncbi:hypothetical protein BDF22DRAFT_271638 [Syncephalis plumigaleata]|nr:hypothetical protein BDF22DRAFT_271638 [Syncephalis plumigaleata]